MNELTIDALLAEFKSPKPRVYFIPKDALEVWVLDKEAI